MTKTIPTGAARTPTPSTPKTCESKVIAKLMSSDAQRGELNTDEVNQLDTLEHMKHMEAMRKRLEQLEQSQQADKVYLEATHDALQEQINEMPQEVTTALGQCTDNQGSTGTSVQPDNGGPTSEVDFDALGVMVSHHNEERHDESFVTRPHSGHGCNESLDAAVSHDHERQDEPFLTRLCHERYDAPPTPSTPGESELGEDEGSSQAMLSMLEQRLEQMQAEQRVRREELDEYLDQLHANVDEDGESLIDFGKPEEYERMVLQAEASFASSGMFRSVPLPKGDESEEKIIKGMSKIDQLDMVLLEKTRAAKQLLKEHVRKTEGDPFLTEVENASRLGTDRSKRPTARQLLKTLRNAPSAATTAAVEVKDFISKNKVLSSLGKFLNLTKEEEARVATLLAMEDPDQELMQDGMGFGYDAQSAAAIKAIDEKLHQMLGEEKFSQLVEHDSYPLPEPRRKLNADEENGAEEWREGAIDWLWVQQQDRKLHERERCINTELAKVHTEADHDPLCATSMDELLANLRSISTRVETTLDDLGQIDDQPVLQEAEPQLSSGLNSEQLEPQAIDGQTAAIANVMVSELHTTKGSHSNTIPMIPVVDPT
jgi:hypothetical protein